MKTMMDKFVALVVTAVIILVIFNIAMAAIQPYTPFIGISISVIIVLAVALAGWKLLLSRRRF